MDTVISERPLAGPAHAEPAPADPWQADEFDLAAYLGRISYSGSLDASAGTLTALHRAQVAAIPFENLDVLLGREIDLGLPAIQAKLVRAGRGGYCYEHGLLLAAALEQLGFTVERLLARTCDPQVDPRPRTHLVLRVALAGTEWLADAGFGSGLLEPVPLTGSSVHRQDGWHFRVWRGDDGGWRLQERLSRRWETHYTIFDEATYPVDVATANYLTSKSPGSPFANQLVVVRKDGQRIRRLIGREYAVVGADGMTSSRTVTGSQLGGLLAELGVPLPAEDVASLAERHFADSA